MAHRSTKAPRTTLEGITTDSLSYQGVSESLPAMLDNGCGAGVGKNGSGNEEFVAPAVGEMVGEIVGEIVGKSVGAADGPYSGRW